jgi:hypothetical protein
MHSSALCKGDAHSWRLLAHLHITRVKLLQVLQLICCCH